MLTANLIATGAIVVTLIVAGGGCGSDSGSDADDAGSSTSSGGPGIVARAENVLKAAGYWKQYGITQVDEIADGGVFVYTALDPGMDLEANDICNQLGNFESLLLVKVYDQDGNEIEAEACGDVSD